MTLLRDFRFTPASRGHRRTGLLGWVAFQIGTGWRVDGVAVRRTLRGELRFSFPARVDAAGREHPYLRPISDSARRELERAVLAELEEPLEVLRPAPRGAHVEARAADEQAEEHGPHGNQGTARRRAR